MGIKVAFEAAVGVPREHILEVLALWQHLTTSEGGDSAGVCDILLKVHNAAVLKASSKLPRMKSQTQVYGTWIVPKK